MKVDEMKSDPTRTFKERADVQYLVQLPGVDDAEIRRYFDKAGLSGRFDEINRSRMIAIRTTAADVVALRRASQAAAASVQDYLAFLARFPPASTESLRARRRPRGEPFRLE
jgi:hypothetical protein